MYVVSIARAGEDEIAPLAAGPITLISLLAIMTLIGTTTAPHPAPDPTPHRARIVADRGVVAGRGGSRCPGKDR